MNLLCTVDTDNCGVPTWCFMLERFLMFSSCNFSPDSFHGNLSRVFWFIMIPGFKAYSLPDNTPDTTPRLINYFNYFHQEMFWGGLVPEAYTGGGIWGLIPPPWISKFYGFQGVSVLHWNWIQNARFKTSHHDVFLFVDTICILRFLSVLCTLNNPKFEVLQVVFTKAGEIVIVRKFNLLTLSYFQLFPCTFQFLNIWNFIDFRPISDKYCSVLN